nr:pentapeptide repeat-containing protein [Anaerolineaceae bacterium]
MNETICKWKSKNGRYACKRSIFGDSEYCLFHKPEKNEVEGKIFWKIINWDCNAGLSSRDITILNKYEFRTKLRQDELRELDIKIRQVDDRNFTEFDEREPNFHQIRKIVVEQKINADIWRNGPNFRGFVFPEYPSGHHIVFNYQNRSAPYIAYDFTEVIFESEANFSNYHFISNVVFRNTVFKGWVIFTNSIFERNCSFIEIERINPSSPGGTKPFGNTKFMDNLYVKNCQLVSSLRGASFSDQTDIILEEMDFQNQDFKEKTYRIAITQAKRTGNEDLVKKYRKLRKFDYDKLSNDLVKISGMITSKNASHKKENLYNDDIRDLLDAMGYDVRDQTRAGESASGKSAGELDIQIRHLSKPVSIIESFKLDYCNKTT